MSQLTFADFLKESGMAQALEAKPDWSALADEWFANLPEGTEFTSEDLVSAIGLPDYSTPNNNNAVGAKMSGFARKSQEVGFRKTVRVISHSRRIVIWRKK